MPSKARAEPPSGTGALPDENLNLTLFDVVCELKVQFPRVESKAWLVLEMIPVPVMVRKPPPWVTMVDVSTSKVNPPTLNKAGIGVDGSKFHGTLEFAAVFWAMPLKLPLPAPAVLALAHEVMMSAVFR